MSNHIPKKSDVVILGGGIAGCSAAYFLSQQGLQVTVCEKGEIAGEQSSRNWGFIRKQGRHPAEIPLMVLSLEEWNKLPEPTKKEIGFHIGGTIYLSETEARYKANLAWLEHAKNFELDSKFLTLDELNSKIPAIAKQSRGALYTPSDARAEPDLATRAIAQSAQNHGATILTQCAVRGIELQGGKVSEVITESGSIQTSSVICAGGAWSGYFCRHLDIVFPHLKVISSVMSTAAAPNITNASIWSSGLGMRRRLDGGYSVAFGGSSSCEITPDFFRFVRHYIPAYRHSKEVVKLKWGNRFFNEMRWPQKWEFDQVTPFEQERTLNPAPDLKLLGKAYTTLGEVFPDLKGIEIKKRWAGMIDVTPDELPVLSAVDSVPGLTISTGYSGHGFGIGLGAGKIAGQIATGVTPQIDVSALSVNRFL